jgi:hypothetical protein
VRRGFDLGLDHLQPLLRVLGHRQISLGLGRTRAGEETSDLGGLRESLLFGGEERTPAKPGRVAVVDLPQAPVLAEADLELGSCHRPRRSNHGRPPCSSGLARRSVSETIQGL